MILNLVKNVQKQSKYQEKRSVLSAGKLDSVDKKILKTLQEKGRITNVDLAEKVGITAPPCLRRVRALEEAGYIEGYHADLNHKSLGYTITAFILVGLNSNSEADLSAFEDKVNSWPLVRECYLVNGEYDFILKVVAKDLTEYQEFLTGELTPTPHVSSVKTAFSVRIGKNVTGIPFEQS
jgi:DNA-binding Lrp family transcriptional regulator